MAWDPTTYDRECSRCGKITNLTIQFGDWDYELRPVCTDCIGKLIAEVHAKRDAELQAERDSGDRWWSKTPKDKPISHCWHAVWYIRNNVEDEQHIRDKVDAHNQK